MEGGLFLKKRPPFIYPGDAPDSDIFFPPTNKATLISKTLFAEALKVLGRHQLLLKLLTYFGKTGV